MSGFRMHVATPSSPITVFEPKKNYQQPNKEGLNLVAAVVTKSVPTKSAIKTSTSMRKKTPSQSIFVSVRKSQQAMESNGKNYQNIPKNIESIFRGGLDVTPKADVKTNQRINHSRQLTPL